MSASDASAARLAVPVDELHPYHGKIESYAQLPPILLDQIRHFFAHYKDLEPGKWARIGEWRSAEEAAASIDAASGRQTPATQVEPSSQTVMHPPQSSRLAARVSHPLGASPSQSAHPLSQMKGPHSPPTQRPAP